MKYSKMKKTMAVIGIAALLACPNGALTAMAETEDAQTEETETETETETKDESEDETSTDEPDTQKTSTENKKGEEDAVNEITADGGQKISSEDNDGRNSSSEKTIKQAVDLTWDEKTGIVTFKNPNDFRCGYCITIYKDGKLYYNYGHYEGQPHGCSIWSIEAGATWGEHLFNYINDEGKYTFTVTLVEWLMNQDPSSTNWVESEQSPEWNYVNPGTKLPTPTVTRTGNGKVRCKVEAGKPVLQFGYNLKWGDKESGWFGGDQIADNSSNEDEIDVIALYRSYGHSIDPRYDYSVQVKANSGDRNEYADSDPSDWKQILEATESFDDDDDDDSNNSSGSSNEEASEPEPAPVYVPTTPEEKARYSVVGKETVKCTTTNSSYSVDVKNSLQGSKCFDSINAVLGDYTIGRTFNILPQGQYVYHTDTKARITLTIPQALQAAGRTYKMICVTEKGQPIELQDVDNSANTITFETDTYYAFALVYKDGAAN